MEKQIEKRSYKLECRALESEGKRFIEGYALLYEHRSKLIWDWGGTYFEIIKRGALDEILANPDLDVILTPNHTYRQVIARTKSGTLKLTSDEKGLLYRAEVPDISYANDIYESIRRGDTFESSFTFSVSDENQSWSKDEEDNDVRTVEKINELIEVAPVTWGAYSDTVVAARSLEKTKVKGEPVKDKPIDLYQKELEILKLKK